MQAFAQLRTRLYNNTLLVGLIAFLSCIFIFTIYTFCSSGIILFYIISSNLQRSEKLEKSNARISFARVRRGRDIRETVCHCNPFCVWFSSKNVIITFRNFAKIFKRKFDSLTSVYMAYVWVRG